MNIEKHLSKKLNKEVKREFYIAVHYFATDIRKDCYKYSINWYGTNKVILEIHKPCQLDMKSNMVIEEYVVANNPLIDMSEMDVMAKKLSPPYMTNEEYPNIKTDSLDIRQSLF